MAFGFTSEFSIKPGRTGVGCAGRPSGLVGAAVPGPSAGSLRYRLTFPAYANYTYEVYGNPTFAGLGWAASPFSLTQTGAIDRHKFTATANGTLNLFVDAKAIKGFYLVSFRVPNANTGTP